MEHINSDVEKDTDKSLSSPASDVSSKEVRPEINANKSAADDSQFGNDGAVTSEVSQTEREICDDDSSISQLSETSLSRELPLTEQQADGPLKKTVDNSKKSSQSSSTPKQSKITNRSFACDTCPSTFPDRLEYREHLQSAHNKKFRVHKPPTWKRERRVYTCEVCNVDFQVMKVFIQHMKEAHNQPKPFQCSTCIARFVSLRSVMRHFAEFHQDGKTYNGKGFFDKEKREFVCCWCGERFPTKGQMYKHNALAHEGGSTVCELCGDALSSPSSLAQHKKRKHSSELPFTCKVCQKSFPVQQALVEHSYIHLEVGKPFKCDICQKEFSRKRVMLRHREGHSDERRFLCSECGKGFKQKVNLEAHMRLHGGEKPYKCWSCGKSFTQNILLTKHLKSHPEEQRLAPSLLGNMMEE